MLAKQVSKNRLFFPSTINFFFCMQREMHRWLLLLIVLLHGCVTIPNHELAESYDSAHLDVEESFDQDHWPVAEWWKTYEDPTLTFLIETALAENPNLKMTEARFEAAHQVSKQRWATLFPEITFDPNNNYEHFSKYGFFRQVAPTVPPIVNDVTINLNYHWEIDFWGKNRNLFRAAIGEMNAQFAEVQASKLMLATSIAYTYAELQFLLRKKEILKQKVSHDTDYLSIREKREKHALDTSQDILQAKSDQLDIEAQLASLETQIQTDIHELKALSGLGQDTKLEIALRPLKPSIPSLPANLSLDLIAHRPDLAAQKQRMEAAARRIDAAKTNFYPSFNLIGYAGAEVIHWRDLFKAASFDGSLEPAIHLPIFTAGRIRAELYEKVQEFNEAVQDYNDLILHAAQDVADRITSLNQIVKELTVRKQAFEVISKLEQITSRRIQHSLDTELDLITIQNRLLDEELLLANLETGRELANILLIRSLGGSYESP
jgi:NodT family efflux transporter outer membrane factor (OMF) lipoprotein